MTWRGCVSLGVKSSIAANRFKNFFTIETLRFLSINFYLPISVSVSVDVC
jgi:hypothetical protein